MLKQQSSVKTNQLGGVAHLHSWEAICFYAKDTLINRKLGEGTNSCPHRDMRHSNVPRNTTSTMHESCGNLYGSATGIFSALLQVHSHVVAYVFVQLCSLCRSPFFSFSCWDPLGMSAALWSIPLFWDLLQLFPDLGLLLLQIWINSD